MQPKVVSESSTWKKLGPCFLAMTTSRRFVRRRFLFCVCELSLPLSLYSVVFHLFLLSIYLLAHTFIATGARNFLPCVSYSE